jgi:hypothetical protein
MITLAARAYSPPSDSSCLDRVSLPILEDCSKSALSFWKISPPLNKYYSPPTEMPVAFVIFCCGNGGKKSGNTADNPAGQIRGRRYSDALTSRLFASDKFEVKN